MVARGASVSSYLYLESLSCKNSCMTADSLSPAVIFNCISQSSHVNSNKAQTLTVITATARL